MSQAVQWIVDRGLGDMASVAGLGVSLLGFVCTIVLVVRSRRAAEAAEAAALTARDRISRFDAATELSTAISMMQEIKRLHREKLWAQLPDRYSTLRQSLITIKVSHSDLTEEQATMVQGAIQHFKHMEGRIDQHLSSEQQGPLDFTRLNRIVTRQLDNMTELMMTLRMDVRE